jgi:hypothetical protein
MKIPDFEQFEFLIDYYENELAGWKMADDTWPPGRREREVEQLTNLVNALKRAKENEEDLRLTRLYCAEVASYVEDEIYDERINRSGISEDAKAVYRGEMDLTYLDKPAMQEALVWITKGRWVPVNEDEDDNK